MKRFGEKLRTLRKRRGLSLRKLSSMLGFSSHSYIDDIEHGRNKPSIELVIMIAELFDVSTDQLLKDDMEID